MVDFEYGGTDSSPVTGDGVAIRARCVVPSAVRGPSCYPPPRFIVAGTGTSATVTDTSTKLVWQRSFERDRDDLGRGQDLLFAGVIAFAEHEGAANHRRLHGSGTAGTIDTGVFPKTPVDYFWTSSPVAGSPDKAWIVSFSSGATFRIPSGDMWRVRCVR